MIGKPPSQRPGRRLDAGDPCPLCGAALSYASPSGAYLECGNGHVDGRKVRCFAAGCRRLATSFNYDAADDSRSAWCEDHDKWPLPPAKPGRPVA